MEIDKEALARQQAKLAKEKLEKEARMHRWMKRHKVSDLLDIIVTREIFDCQKIATSREPLPVTFADYYEFRDAWKPAFLREVQAFLASKKRGLSEAQLAELRGLTAKQPERESGKPSSVRRPFQAWLKVYGPNTGMEKTVDFLLYEYPQEEDGPSERSLPHKSLAAIKEFDLLVISNQKLEKGGKPVEDVKDLATQEYIR